MSTTPLAAANAARRLLDAQRAAFMAAGPVDVATRKARLQRVIDLLIARSDALCAACRDDFGGRSELFTLMNDVLGSIAALKHARDHVHEWVGDEPRAGVAPFDQFGASAWVMRQPKGVVGIIGTWNAPLFTLFAPLASAFAAGNRAVLKPSEVTPRCAEAVAAAVADAFAPEELAVVTGGAEVAAAFAAEPWDHLVFTGSTQIGREVMKAASANLVPVTLELGGKSPVLVGRSADIAVTAERITAGKCSNAGQLCVSPDTVWLPAERLEEFLAAMRASHARMYPPEGGRRDIVPLVNERHRERVEAYVADAEARGARVETVGPLPGSSDAADRRLPLRVVIDAPEDSAIARNEIFGPAMLVRGYREIAEAVQQINAGERPLALYYFGSDAAEQRWVLEHTLSGGVSINDVLMHAALHDAPFGGVGASGIGHYHGREGFLEFSHTRSVFKMGEHDPRREWGMLPPYTPQFEQMMLGALTP